MSNCYVNTIEFGDRKAVLNSYSERFISVLRPSMEEQRSRWAKMFPNATVLTTVMSEEDTMRLVASTGSARNEACWEIGRASEAV